MPNKNNVILLIITAVLFQLLSFLIYGQSLRYSLVGDDYNFIFEGLQEKAGFVKIWFNRFGNLKYYRPVEFLSYRLNFLVARLQPYTYHLVNIVLHGLNSTLLFFIVRLLLKGSLFISLASALFFMVHPLNSIAVNWISARGELLCCFFILLTIMNYYFFLNISSKRGIYFVSSLFTCFLASASKEHAFTLPLLILVSDIWIRPQGFLKNRIVRVLPFFILLGIFIKLRETVLGNISWGGYGEYYAFDYSRVFENLLRSMKMIVFPVQFILNRNFYLHTVILFLISMSFLAVLYKDKKTIFSMLWFFVTFGPFYTFYPFPSYNLYPQNIGFCLFIPFIVEFYDRLFFQNKKILKRVMLVGTIFLLLSIYGLLTIKRNTYAQRAALTGYSFIKGVFELYPRYPEGSVFYFINVPFLLGENQIYGGSDLVASALSLNYGIYHKKIPSYAFTFMLDTLRVENEIDVEVKDNKTLVISSREASLNYRFDEEGAEYAFVDEIADDNEVIRKRFIVAKKIRIILKEKTLKLPKKHFFYFSNGVVYELKNFGLN